MEKRQKTVVVLATGGTIAGVGEAGKTTGYRSGSLSAEDLIAEIPGIEMLAKLEVLQICNLNSDDIPEQVWFTLVKTIHTLEKRPEVAGFVITHGTDTMEETAYFLQLTARTEKPIVLTGSMRPSTAISADGSMNLYQAVAVAAAQESRGRGVLVVFSNQIYSARYLTKTNTSSLTTMSGGMQGSLGTIIDHRIYYHYQIENRHTTHTEFDIETIPSLQKVAIVYFHAQAEVGLLDYALANADGVVIIGAGMGQYSLAFQERIAGAKIPVVISTRSGSGVIPKDSLLNENAITALDLPPQKAAVLLRLGLTKFRDSAQLQRIFCEY